MLKKIIKILLITFGSLVSLLIILVLIIRIGWMNKFLAQIISEQAGKTINGELVIGSIKGNIFSGFSLNNVILTQDSDKLLECDEIEIDYILKSILHKNISITLLHIKNLSLSLRQDNDSLWNFMKIMKSSEKTDTSSGDFTWKIIVDDFILDNLRSSIESIDTNKFIPESIVSSIHLDAMYSKDSLNINLESFNITSVHPDFEIVSMTGGVSKVRTRINWQNIELGLKNSLLTTNGYFDPGDNDRAGIKLHLDPLSFEDFSKILPDLKLYGQPQISFSLEGDADKYNLDLQLSEHTQNADLTGWIKNFRVAPEYSFAMVLKDLDASSFTKNEKMKSQVSGTINIRGTGVDLKTNQANISAEFNDIQHDGQNLNRLLIKILKNKDEATGSLSTEIYEAAIDMNFNLNEIFGNPGYEINGKYSNVNLQNLPGLDSFPSDLNGNMHFKGKGISPDKLIMDLLFRSERSHIFGETISDFTISANYNKGNYAFDLSEIKTPFFRLSADGQGNVFRNNDISFIIQPLDLRRLQQVFDLPPFAFSGKIGGNITGSIDSLKGFAGISLENIVYDSLSVGKLEAEVDFNIADSLYNGNLTLNSDNIRFGSFALKSAGFAGAFTEKSVDAELQLNVNDSLKTAFAGTVEGFENPLIRIKNLGINYNGAEWSGGHDSAYVLLNKDFVFINKFFLNSGNQKLELQGRFAFTGDEDLEIKADSLDLKTLPLNYVLPYNIEGIFTSDILVTGTSAKPVINGHLFLHNLAINNYRVDSLGSELNYDNEILTYLGTVKMNPYESVNLSLNLPIHISFNDSIYLMKSNNDFSATLSYDSLDLNEIFTRFPIKNTSVKGFASARIDVKNKLSDPLITGEIGIREAAFKNSKYGMDYGNINLETNIENKRLTIDNFDAGTGKGTLNLQGFINLNNIDSIDLTDFEFNFKANDFQALKSNMAELNFNSDIKIKGPSGNSTFDGSINVNRSKINVDYFGALFSEKKDDPDSPLLIEALKDTVSFDVEKDTSKAAGFSGTSLYKNLKGEAVLALPGNTWITGKDMNLELEGNLRAVKSAGGLSLFGDLSVRRGFYKIYGRSFNFSRGKITFTGASEFNPDLDFEIIYSFRDIEKEMKELKLTVKGRMPDPTLEFRLGDEILEEKDAISYIVFGKSINQLGEGERDRMSGEDVALGAAFTQLSSALKGVLQESAGVDVFEVTGGENWKSGNVTIGKYITNKLFLSYERTFDFDKQTKTADTEKIMLEYQILRNLILKATNQSINSGFDLIFRKTWR
jgi:autotransporter translocation and assembly factor TamB